MTFEGTDPVSGISLAEHGLSIFTSRDTIIIGHIVGIEVGKGQKDHGTGVTRTGERRLTHAHARGGGRCRRGTG